MFRLRSKPPELVPSKQVCLPALPEAEGCVDALEVGGQAEVGDPLGIASLHLVRFVDPHLIAWEGNK